MELLYRKLLKIVIVYFLAGMIGGGAIIYSFAYNQGWNARIGFEESFQARVLPAQPGNLSDFPDLPGRILPAQPGNLSDFPDLPGRILPAQPGNLSVPGNLKSNQYRIGSMLSPNSTNQSRNDIVISLSFMAPEMTLSCFDGFRNISKPIANSSNSSLFMFENTTCIPEKKSWAAYKLPSGKLRNITIGLSYERMYEFRENLTWPD